MIVGGVYLGDYFPSTGQAPVVTNRVLTATIRLLPAFSASVSLRPTLSATVTITPQPSE